MMKKFLSHKTALTSLTALTVFLPISACDLANNFTKADRSTNSEIQDYRDALAPREATSDAAPAVASDVPELTSYVAEDSKALKSYPLVSLSINQSIPLREALFELAKQGNYDVELDPRISGSVIFTARNKPLDEVIDRICEISGLRYKFDQNTLRIELDTPYSKTYKIDYLSFVRKNASNIKTDASVSSSGEAESGSESSFSVDSSSESDFWKELDANLKQILDSNSSANYLKTDADPQISLSTSNPANPPVPPIDAAALGATAPQAGIEDYVSSPQLVPSETTVAVPTPASTEPATTTTTTTTTTDSPATDAPAPQPVSAQPATNAQQPVLKVESLPTALSTGNSSGGNQVAFTPAYSINKQAGIVSVYANERVQRQIQSYLTELRRSSTSQVLIEAKVLEVSLTDEFATGINWNLLDRVGDFSLTGTFSKPSINNSSTNVVTFGFAGDDISSFVSALSHFGTVHALASPRLTVLNNQAAVLNVAKNLVYFEISGGTSSTTTAGTSETQPTATAKTVPEGVLINVMPSIDLDKRMVSMQVRPTITKVDKMIPDPINAGNSIPQMNVQEVDSVVNMKNKEMMVMGGLLQDSTISSQEGIPIASEVPVLGGLFRNQGDNVRKTELVIFIKATILDEASDSIHQTDKDLYKVFGQDRRPSKL